VRGDGATGGPTSPGGCVRRSAAFTAHFRETDTRALRPAEKLALDERPGPAYGRRGKRRTAGRATWTKSLKTAKAIVIINGHLDARGWTRAGGPGEERRGGGGGGRLKKTHSCVYVFFLCSSTDIKTSSSWRRCYRRR